MSFGSGGSGDPTRELTHRFVMSMLAISRDPGVRAWLDRPRSWLLPPCAFLIGCAAAGAISWRWQESGLMALGYLTTPLLGPLLAVWPASRQARNRLPDLPRFRGSTAAAPFYALAGAASVVCAAGCFPSVWRATDNYILIGPLIAVIFAVVLTPMFLFMEAETRRDEMQPDQTQPPSD
jgi:hypothetical protein